MSQGTACFRQYVLAGVTPLTAEELEMLDVKDAEAKRKLIHNGRGGSTRGVPVVCCPGHVWDWVAGPIMDEKPRPLNE